MEFNTKFAMPEKHPVACVAAGVFESRKLSGAADALDKAAHGHIRELLRSGDMDGKMGTTRLLYSVRGVAAERVLLVGLGREKEFGEKEYRDCARAALAAVQETGARDASLYFAELEVPGRDAAWNARQLVLAAADITYRFDRMKSKKAEEMSLAHVSISAASKRDAAALERGLREGSAIAGKKDRPVVLVGKGITFDTGGISIKPAADLDQMKFDMCGAASVLGTLRAAAELSLKLNIVGLIPTCENMPGGAATKPGDIVTSMSGQTIEILNTDAEGRLILADALSYAERFEPQAVVDVATLTGACIVALGHVCSGLFANKDDLAHELEAAGAESLDRVWRLPLWEDYQEQLKSNFADFANIGGRAAGSVTAACFLSRFTREYDWAHLDIAGTAWKSGKEKGATGRPVPLLTTFLIKRAE